MKPLLCILSPRDIPEVIESLNRITKYDKLWVKYYDNPNAHAIAKQYFIDHPEYTHVSRISDDTVITEEQIDALVSDLQQHPKIECISAVGPVNGLSKGLTHYGVCMNKRPAKAKKERVYEFIPISKAPKEGLYKVKYGGGYAAFFSRRLLTDGIISWQTDLVAEITKHHNKHGYQNEITCCNDVVISHELAEAKVDEYVDFGIVVKHLKGLPIANQYQLGQGRIPYVEFEPAAAAITRTTKTR